jgi:hypothetical protein
MLRGPRRSGRTAVVRLLAAALVAAAIVAPAAAQPARRDGLESAGAAIRGRVVTSDTGLPIVNASITLQSSAARIAVSGGDHVYVDGPAARTGPDGGFEISGIQPGQYRLLITPGAAALRYIQARYPDPASAAPAALTLRPGDSIDDVLVRLPRAGVITGRVLDGAGEPLALVTIGVFEHLGGGRILPVRGPGGFPARTDDLGSFRIFGLKPGSYIVAATPQPAFTVSPHLAVAQVRDPGPTFYPGTPNAAEAVPIRIASGQEHGGVEFAIAPRGARHTLRGVVVDSEGHTARGVGLTLQSAAAQALPEGLSRPPAGMTTTRGDGAFELRDLAPGEYTIVAKSSGGKGAEYAASPVSIAQDVDGLLVRLQPAGSIRGEIVFDGQAPRALAGLYVRSIVAHGQAGTTMSVQPEADGTFVLDQQFGHSFVRVNEWRGWHLAAVLQDGKDITNQPTEFSSGSAPVKVVLTRQAGSLSGVTSTADGTPVEGVVVLFSSDPGTWYERFSTTRLVRSGFDGRYQVDGLGPGSYLVIALPDDEAALTGATPAFFQLLAARAAAITVRDRQRVSQPLTIMSMR